MEELEITGWTDEQKNAFLEMQFTAQWRDYSQRFPCAEQSIVLDNGTPAGRIWINRSDEDIRLLDIILLPKYQNTGTGTVLLHQLQDEARASGKKLHHAVHKDNVNALRFYERLGFTIVEDYDTYCVMEWTSNTNESH
jgi:ribosomal protein S18 acetylase RimI-like enzyme